MGKPGPALLGLGTINRNGGFRGENLRTYGGETPERILLRPGDLYVSLKDVTHAADLLGAVARVPNGVEVGRLTQDTIRLDVNDEAVDRDYLYLALMTPQYRSYCRARGTGTTNLDLSQADFLSYEIRMFAPFEQRAIADVIGGIDEKILANERLAHTVEGLLRIETESMWFSARGRSFVPIETIFELNPRTKRPTETEPVYIDMKKLPESGSGIAPAEKREAKGGTRFMQGDTLMARITPCLENRKTGFVDSLASDQVGIGSTEFITIRTREPYAKPLSYFLAVDEGFRDFAIRHMAGTSGRQRVSASVLAKYEVPQPEESWILDFGARATLQFEYLKSLRAQNTTLSALRDTLLPPLMSGKLRVRDAERAVSEVL